MCSYRWPQLPVHLRHEMEEEERTDSAVMKGSGVREPLRPICLKLSFT